jgi:hypothetical protein
VLAPTHAHGGNTKRQLLSGICPEVAELLCDRYVPINTFSELRFLKTLRQIEAGQAMIAMNRFKASYVRSLVAATPEDQLVEGRKRRIRGLSEARIAVMQNGSEIPGRELRQVEQSCSAGDLDLMLAISYIRRLLGNARIVCHLAQHHGAILSEFQQIAGPEQSV